MTRLTVPGLGPIIGHVTHESVRIWARADRSTALEVSSGANVRTLGVLGIFEQGSKRFARGEVPCFYFRLPREYSRTGTITIGHKLNPWKDKKYLLQPDTRYVARVGVLHLDDPDGFFDKMEWDELRARLPDVSNWEVDLRTLPDAECEATFFTFPDPADGRSKFKFLLGSCRYPGLAWKQRKSDRIFGPMADRATRRDGARFALMVGDQIYADTLNRHIPIARA